MKKFIIVSILLFFSFSVNSQIYLGFTGGLNGANVRFDDDALQRAFKYKDKLRYGYNVGLTGDFYFSKVLSVDVDFLYTLKGYAYEQTYSMGYKQFNYGQISAAGKLDLNPGSDVIVSPYIAPYGGYWITGKRMHSDFKTGIVEEDKIYLSNDSTFAYNRYDIGIAAGVDFKFKQQYHRQLVVGIKYEQGMVSTDIDKVDGWLNKNFSIYIRYLFRVKK